MTKTFSLAAQLTQADRACCRLAANLSFRMLTCSAACGTTRTSQRCVTRSDSRSKPAITVPRHLPRKGERQLAGILVEAFTIQGSLQPGASHRRSAQGGTAGVIRPVGADQRRAPLRTLIAAVRFRSPGASSAYGTEYSSSQFHMTDFQLGCIQLMWRHDVLWRHEIRCQKNRRQEKAS